MKQQNENSRGNSKRQTLARLILRAVLGRSEGPVPSRFLWSESLQRWFHDQFRLAHVPLAAEGIAPLGCSCSSAGAGIRAARWCLGSGNPSGCRRTSCGRGGSAARAVLRGRSLHGCPNTNAGVRKRGTSEGVGRGKGKKEGKTALPGSSAVDGRS